MKYEKAKAEVVMFDNSDVVTTSEPCGKPSENGAPGACNQEWKPGWNG